MGYGLSEAQARGRIRRMLQKLQQELKDAGVECVYGEYKLVSLPPTDTGPAFEISYSHGHMSNGESVLMPLIFVREDGKVTWDSYGFLDYRKGIERIKAQFGTAAVAK